MKIVRRLYDWTLSWSHSRYGTWALAGLSFAESSFFPIPPDPLLMALAMGRPARAFWFALVCTGASVAGGVLGYGIGWLAFEAVGRPILEFYHAMEHFERLVRLYNQNAYWIIFVAAFTPIPYKAITITAGVCEVALLPFIAISFLGRGARFFLVSGAIYLFGPQVKAFIDKYFNLLTVAFTVLLAAGFAAVAWWGKRGP